MGSEQAEPSQDAPYFLPRKGVSTERDQRAAVRRVGFSHGNKRDVVSRETGLNLQEGDLVSDFENDSVRVFGKGGPRG